MESGPGGIAKKAREVSGSKPTHWTQPKSLERHQHSRTQGGIMNKKVYVANLPFQAGEPELKALFSKAGDVMSVNVVAGKHTGQPRGNAS